ncbi:MAG: PKD domain-containing protein [Candidatus Tectomicrobia bacterium]|nr:PKD domain-containing protein [Candidatus Tectomicrobia bacterium]
MKIRSGWETRSDSVIAAGHGQSGGSWSPAGLRHPGRFAKALLLAILISSLSGCGGGGGGEGEEETATPVPPEIAAPVADFTATPVMGSAPLEVSFRDASSSPDAAITAWMWDFGDGTTSTDQNPTHHFDDPGGYTISLMVTASSGSDTLTRQTLVQVSALAGPVTDFTATPVMGSAPLEVSFQDSSSSPDAAITAWRWDFGDGTTSTEQNPTHAFNSPGGYTVSLTVTASSGSDTRTRQALVLVSAPAAASAPVADFTATPLTDSGALTVSFQDSSTSPDAAITEWLWDFGDGNTSTRQHPRHTFTSYGRYLVSLTVTASSGSATRRRNINVDTVLFPVTDIAQPVEGDLETVLLDGVEVEAARNEILVFFHEDVSNADIREAQEAILEMGGTIRSLNLELRTIQAEIPDDVQEASFVIPFSGRTEDARAALEAAREMVLAAEAIVAGDRAPLDTAEAALEDALRARAVAEADLKAALAVLAEAERALAEGGGDDPEDIRLRPAVIDPDQRGLQLALEEALAAVAAAEANHAAAELALILAERHFQETDEARKAPERYLEAAQAEAELAKMGVEVSERAAGWSIRGAAVNERAALQQFDDPPGFRGDYWIDEIGARDAWNALSGLDLHPTTIGVVDTGGVVARDAAGDLVFNPAVFDVVDGSRIAGFAPPGHAPPRDANHGRYVTGFAAGFNSGPLARGVNTYNDVVYVDTPLLYRDIGDNIQEAIMKGADVVNISLGGVSDCGQTREKRIRNQQGFRLAMSNAIDYARRHDVLLVWAAGNDCEKLDDKYFAREDVAGVDAWGSHALIVGASTDGGNDACFSRMGGVVNIMAPGHRVGYGPILADGTSFAAPIVAGAASLIKAIESTLSAEETRSILVETASESVAFNTSGTTLRQCSSVRPNMPGQASRPAGLLNLNAAVESALLARGVELVHKEGITLARGETRDVTVQVEVPAASVTALDVVFLIDQTRSYWDDIDMFQGLILEIVASLTNNHDIDVQFGVAGFADFPGRHGDMGDVPYRLYQDVTFDTAALMDAVNELDAPLLSGGDEPESQYEALYRAAREVGWRDGALRVLVLATDADFHDSDTDPGYPGKGRTAALNALREEHVIVVGLQSGDGAGATAHLQELATTTEGTVQSPELDRAQIIAAIIRGLDDAIARVNVTLEELGAESWVKGIQPKMHEGAEGGTIVNFTVSLQGQRDRPRETLEYNVYLWARADGSALLSRTKIPIVVNP